MPFFWYLSPFRTLGRGWGFTDVFGLDEESLKMVPSPCVGIIFLYPFSQVEMRKKKLGKNNGQKCEGVWYMNQVIGNACGAVALMHTVMNTLDTVSSDSKFLKKFSADAKDADSRNRGKLFGSALRELHDEVSGRGQTEAPKPNADLDFHFVSLVAVSAPARRSRPPPLCSSMLLRLSGPPLPPHTRTTARGTSAAPRRSTGICLSSMATTTDPSTWVPWATATTLSCRLR